MIKIFVAVDSYSCIHCRDEVAKATSMFGLLAMVAVSSTLVLQMAMSQASTQSELELLTSLATRLCMMRSVHQRWL